MVRSLAGALCALVGLVACSAPEDTPRAAAEGPAPILPQVATYLALSPAADSVGVLARATAGVRSIKVEGQVPTPCKGHPPHVGQTEAATGRLVLRIDVSVPPACVHAPEVYAYTVVLDRLAPGRYPLEVRLRVHPPDPERPASQRLVLLDTLAVR